MLVCVTFEYVERLCGKRNFKRRRHYTPYTFFYHVAGYLANVVCVLSRLGSLGGLFSILSSLCRFLAVVCFSELRILVFELWLVVDLFLKA